MKRDLKYIKLYEAFDSRLMSKTLGFISSESKGTFISDIKKICDTIDYPYSKLSDDLFEYLPFNSALKKNIEQDPPEKIECKQESPWIPGEFCQGGSIKRTWGDHTRMVECPNCKGKGYTIPEVKYDAKLIKFWFSKEGKYIKSTASDGRPGETLDMSLDGYRVIQRLDYRGIHALPDESLVWVKIREGQGYIRAKVFHAGVGRSYLFQNYHSGDSPIDRGVRNRGHQFGRYSWVVTSNSDFIECFSIEPKEEGEEGGYEDYYKLNKNYQIRSGNIYIDKHSVGKFDLKDANFAIILDLKNLKSKDFVKRTDLRLSRSKMREGIPKTHEEIRKDNLERYLNKLVSTYSEDSGFSNMTRIINVGLSSMPLTFIAYKINFGNIESAITNIYFSIKKSDFSELYHYIRRVYKEKNEKLENLKINIDNGKKSFKSSTNVDDKKRLEIWEKWEFLNKKLFEKIRSYNCETIEEIEILWGKILTIRLLFDNESRYPSLYRFNTVIRYASSSYSIYSELAENFSGSRIEKAMEELEILEKIINSI